jgi:hypothetical protein
MRHSVVIVSIMLLQSFLYTTIITALYEGAIKFASILNEMHLPAVPACKAA